MPFPRTLEILTACRSSGHSTLQDVQVLRSLVVVVPADAGAYPRS